MDAAREGGDGRAVRQDLVHASVIGPSRTSPRRKVAGYTAEAGYYGRLRASPTWEGTAAPRSRRCRDSCGELVRHAGERPADAARPPARGETPRVRRALRGALIKPLRSPRRRARAQSSASRTRRSRAAPRAARARRPLGAMSQPPRRNSASAASLVVAGDSTAQAVAKVAAVRRKSIVARTKSFVLSTNSFFLNVPDLLLQHRVIAGSRCGGGRAAARRGRAVCRRAGAPRGGAVAHSPLFPLPAGTTSCSRSPSTTSRRA